MKKRWIFCVALLGACARANNDGAYVAHVKSEYSIAYDTLTIANGIVKKTTGYNRIRNGKLKAREYKAETWRLNEYGTPVITFKGGDLMLGNSIYQKIK